VRIGRPVAITCLTAFAGCSYIALPSVPADRPHRNVPFAATCSTSAMPPLTDMLGATVGGLFSVLALSIAYAELTRDFGEDDGSGYAVALAVGLPFGAMFAGYGLSARHGMRHLEACKAERRKPIYRGPRLQLADDLVESARRAAQRDDCPTARALLVRAHAADVEVHAAALRDPAIARCAHATAPAP
jgi:hypothetical protein